MTQPNKAAAHIIFGIRRISRFPQIESGICQRSRKEFEFHFLSSRREGKSSASEALSEKNACLLLMAHRAAIRSRWFRHRYSDAAPTLQCEEASVLVTMLRQLESEKSIRGDHDPWILAHINLG